MNDQKHKVISTVLPMGLRAIAWQLHAAGWRETSAQILKRAEICARTGAEMDAKHAADSLVNVWRELNHSVGVNAGSDADLASICFQAAEGCSWSTEDAFLGGSRMTLAIVRAYRACLMTLKNWLREDREKLVDDLRLALVAELDAACEVKS